MARDRSTNRCQLNDFVRIRCNGMPAEYIKIVRKAWRSSKSWNLVTVISNVTHTLSKAVQLGIITKEQSDKMFEMLFCAINSDDKKS